MRIAKYLLVAACFGLMILLAWAVISQQTRIKPIKEGILWKVIWSDGQGQTGLFREKMPTHPQQGEGGAYQQDMYGILHPDYLEIHFQGRADDHTQIIPFRQIIWLEFGSGGINIPH